MDNKKIASQVIRALHKPTASAGGGGGGEVWRELDFTENGSDGNDSSTQIIYKISGTEGATQNSFFRATVTLHFSDSNCTFRTNAYSGYSPFWTFTFGSEPDAGAVYGPYDVDGDLSLVLFLNRALTESDIFKLEKIEILEQ